MSSAKKPMKPAARKPAAKPAPAAKAPTKRAPKTPAPSEEQIAVHAYHIYEAEGGDPVEHWVRAERELTAPPPKTRTRGSTTKSG